MTAGSRIPSWMIGLLAILCLAALAWTTFGFVLPFRHETGKTVLDTYFTGYDQPTVTAMQNVLSENDVARALLRSMYLGPELVLPALMTMLLFTIVLKLQPGGSYFGKPMHPAFIKAIYALPFIYCFADYAENLSSLIAFGDSSAAASAAALLPWMTKLKFAALAVSAIVILRFVLIRLTPGGVDGR
ncbi:hypothetical protein [Rhizobium mongolense]|uniref:Uncharacterized protein n=2 Tax=Rhizobium mongolense TaxID=57676 RepID=A0ABR6IIR5_9HYPH|nr:hypothetical protein [Rhizobium mongolense]MBB4227762.1 hypothetical protein [Rhizobium mongolense]TVZ65078.1 hypothetical protein BCL32_5359 [Rhizobium mongolense USDA 1844]